MLWINCKHKHVLCVLAHTFNMFKAMIFEYWIITVGSFERLVLLLFFVSLRLTKHNNKLVAGYLEVVTISHVRIVRRYKTGQFVMSSTIGCASREAVYDIIDRLYRNTDNAWGWRQVNIGFTLGPQFEDRLLKYITVSSEMNGRVVEQLNNYAICDSRDYFGTWWF